MSNVQTVQEIYAAFGSGDIPAILARLSDDVEWEYGMADAGVPWLQPLKGRSQVPKFFESLGALEFRQFEPKALLADGNVVVALIDVQLVVKATGRPISETDEVHIWRFDDQGRITSFRHKLDSYQHWWACQAKG